MYVMSGWNKLTKDELVSSDAPNQTVTWSAAATYIVGDLVRSPAGHLFECAVGPAKFLAGGYCKQPYKVDLPNKGHNPDESPTVPAMDRTAYPKYTDIDDCYVESGKLWWMRRDDNFENKYRMFAESPELVTRAASGAISTLRVTFTNDISVATLVAVRTNATTIRYIGPLVPSAEPNDSLSSEFGSNSTAEVREWDLVVPTDQSVPGVNVTYHNFIMRFGVGNVIPANSTFTVEFEHDISKVRDKDYVYCGGLLAGSMTRLGVTLYNTTVGIQDYSGKERDAFGNAEIKERGYTNRVNFKVAIPTERIYATKEYLSTMRAILSVYCADVGLQGTVVAGYFRDFSIPYESYTESIFNLEVEGL